ncbi:MAG: STAS/SEC14 domain-containing protein [Anaerolineae bacterium]|nr:STAS/SEC14 domain-containing protein [Anaerolineae bacterium]
MDFSVEDADGYLMVRVQGEWTADEFGQVMREAANIAQQRGFTRILGDARELAAPKTEFARFQAGQQAVKYFGFDFKVAVVYAEEFINKFAENVAVNRGVNLRIYSSLDEAVSWLKQD